MFGTFVWNCLYGTLVGLCMEFVRICMNTCLEVWNTSFFVESYLEWLFGLVVVFNGGKICIEKMLGFRGDAVRFF